MLKGVNEVMKVIVVKPPKMIAGILKMILKIHKDN